MLLMSQLGLTWTAHALRVEARVWGASLLINQRDSGLPRYLRVDACFPLL